jgi:hypothetical protein
VCCGGLERRCRRQWGGRKHRFTSNTFLSALTPVPTCVPPPVRPHRHMWVCGCWGVFFAVLLNGVSTLTTGVFLQLHGWVVVGSPSAHLRVLFGDR